MKFFCFFFFFLLITAFAEKARFDNYRVYRIQLENEDQLNALRQLAETSDSVNLINFN